MDDFFKYYIVEIDGHIYNHIDINNKPNKYGVCKYFDSFEDAAKWVKRRTSPGMTCYYSIRMKGVNDL